jgi:hypothetical protein
MSITAEVKGKLTSGCQDSKERNNTSDTHFDCPRMQTVMTLRHILIRVSVITEKSTLMKFHLKSTTVTLLKMTTGCQNQ